MSHFFQKTICVFVRKVSVVKEYVDLNGDFKRE